MRRVVSVSDDASDRVLETCASFGLLVRRQKQGQAWRRRMAVVRRDAARIESTLGAGQVALITGTSGSGKSTLLRAVAACVRRRARSLVEVGDVPGVDRPMLDLIPGHVDDVLALLTRAGLADATTIVRSVRELSEGQKWRLRLALCMHEASRSRPATLVIDEFASTLDTTTGACVATMIARWVRREGHRLVAATARSELGAHLAPDLEWNVDERGSLAGVCDVA